MMKTCYDSFQLLNYLKNTIPKYPNLEKKPYTIASKYTWLYVLMQDYSHIINGQEKTICHLITYMSGLFSGSQHNWAALIKGAYTIYVLLKKPLFI